MLNGTRHAVFKLRTKELSEYNITTNSVSVLFTIILLDNEATPSKISKNLHLERHSTSEQLVRMEKEGLVNRVRDLKRKNRIRIEITPKGYDTFEKSCIRESIRTCMSILTLQEKMLLWALLAKIRDRALLLLGRDDISNAYPPSDINILLNNGNSLSDFFTGNSVGEPAEPLEKT